MFAAGLSGDGVCFIENTEFETGELRENKLPQADIGRNRNCRKYRAEMPRCDLNAETLAGRSEDDVVIRECFCTTVD